MLFHNMLGVLKFLLILLEVILLFNLLILVHEVGHYLAARWRGLVVEKFAIWFGKPIWKKKIGGVEYILGSIPAGGYVAIPQLAPMEVLEGKTETDREKLPPVSALDKIIVAFAGPLFSFGLAVAFAVAVWLVGRPVSEAEMTTVVGYVFPEGPEAGAGIQAGDKILEVNGHPVKRFAGMGNVGETVAWNIARSEEAEIPIKLERHGQELTVMVKPVVPERKGWGRKNLRQLMVLPAQTPMVAAVAENSPAARAGLRAGDLVVEANGRPLLSTIALSEIVREDPGNPVTLVVERAGKRETVSVMPQVPEGETQPRLGIFWDAGGKTVLAHPSPLSQLAASVTMIWRTLDAVFSPKSDIKVEHLSGPVGIMNLYYRLFESPDGWRLALWMSVIINVNLALINLLPVPVLDGGHITLALIEAITRRPINIRILEYVQTGFAILIIGFMVYVTFFDVLDLGIGRSRESKPQMSFSPTPAPTP